MTLNADQAQHQNNELHDDAIKHQIREALKDKPRWAKDIASRLGRKSDAHFVRLLHEMESDMEISFNWLRGYRL